MKAKKMAKPVKAWALVRNGKIVAGTDERTKGAVEFHHNVKLSQNERIARVEIREI